MLFAIYKILYFHESFFSYRHYSDNFALFFVGVRIFCYKFTTMCQPKLFFRCKLRLYFPALVNKTILVFSPLISYIILSFILLHSAVLFFTIFGFHCHLFVFPTDVHFRYSHVFSCNVLSFLLNILYDPEFILFYPPVRLHGRIIKVIIIIMV